MRVIARGTLGGFTQHRVQPSEKARILSHLSAWYALIHKAAWPNSAALKQQFRSASIISARRVVFNIKGNSLRLIVEINYEHQIVFIKWLGTHREYDSIDVETVEYDKERYAGPSHSQRS